MPTEPYQRQSTVTIDSILLMPVADAIASTTTPQSGLAQKALRIEMENYSENYHCAGWLMGLEFLLWKKVLDLSMTDGGTNKLPEAYACKLLAESAQGWWHWPQSGSEPEFIAMPDWLALYAEHTKSPDRN